MKPCPYCYEELDDGVRICTHCGKDTTVEPERSSVPPPTEGPVAAPEPIAFPGSAAARRTRGARTGSTNTLALVALSVAIVGGALTFVSAWLTLGCALAAAALAAMAMQQVRSSPETEGGFGFAVAALVLAGLGVIGFLRSLA